MVVAAMTYVQFALYWLCRAAVATVRTRGLVAAMIRGHMNEFHWLTTVMSTSVEMDRLRHGNDDGEEDAHLPAPSMVAAVDDFLGDLTERLSSRNHA